MATKAISIDLGEMAEHAERHLREGEYDTLDEVLQDAVRALDREKAAFDDMLREKVQEALDDPSPALPIDEAMDEVWREIRAEQAR